MKYCTCLIGICAVAFLPTGTQAGTFTDNFSDGLRPAYWTVTETSPGLYSVDATHGDVQLAMVNSNPSNLRNVTISLNLAAAIGQSSIAGNFSTQIDFSSANLTGPGLDQAEFHTFYQDGSTFFDVRSNDTPAGTNNGQQNVHVWNGAFPLEGYTPVASDSGTFTITRTGSTLAGYFDGSLMFSETNGSPLTGISFVLQNNVGSDPISITFDNFVLTASVPEPSSLVMAAAALGMIAIAARSRRRMATCAPRHRAGARSPLESAPSPRR